MIILESLENSKVVSSFEVLDFKKFDDGYYLKIEVNLVDSSKLFIREYLDAVARNYSYHWQDKEGSLIARWDNAPHHKEIITFPHHLHSGDEIKESYKISFAELFTEIEQKILSQVK